MSKTLHNILITLGKMESLPTKAIHSCDTLLFLLENMKSFDEARKEYFKDEQALQVFDWVCQSRLLRNMLGQPEPEILDNIPYPKHIWNALVRQAESIAPVVKGDYLLDRIDTWLLESYSLHNLCEVEPGDTVFDCGTYTGNTSVYFAQKTGETGHVYGFEPAPSTFEDYSENIRSYANITPINAGLTDKSKILDASTVMAFAANGTGARLADDGDVDVPVTAIDIFCETRGIQRVDFIKMDVESAEADVLRGATETIRAYRPKMALSAYHKPEDLFELPQLVSSICPGYKFTLRHYSEGPHETVLFCRHSDDEYYFGKATAKGEQYTSSHRLHERVLLMLMPYVQEGLNHAQSADQLTSVIFEAKRLGEYAISMSEHVENLAKANEALAKENIALRRLLERTKAAQVFDKL